MISGKEVLISWLNDAYALEQSLITVLKNHSSDAVDHPQIRRRIDQHLSETERHGEWVKDCIERLGGSTSTSKVLVGKMSAVLSAMPTAAAQDELVKNAISDVAAENFEIASYRALIEAARTLGEREVVDTCERILRDEERMAEWLDQNLPSVVHEHLAVQAMTA